MMNKIDVNIMTGHWPFRKLYKEDIKSIDKVLRDNNFIHAFISSFNSIFYNDPFQGDIELNETAANKDIYRQIMTINPTLPGWQVDLEYEIEKFHVAGVKIYPTYHGYSLEDKSIKNLIEILEKKRIPLLIVMRLEDERLNYILNIKPLETEEILSFAEATSVPLILLQPYMYEVIKMQSLFQGDRKCYFDTSGLRQSLFSIEKAVDHVSPDCILFGSAYPLLCIKSSIYMVEKALVSEDIKKKIFYKNTTGIFGNSL